ncbi:hypothetical protein D1B31_14350 [Neobacillus notoginsengisoli]|uniref:Uncharacterized protein n=1 Tax=Neobacillus notoginsengisoli TaxID=1578198 RepID=A0A417YRD5_9BACI|nr:hypothetical protein [Neobacillus notoginsengisoli]RHW37964.1 hypothetical protein D1B31_14350 [Neobacillus notoginsengisoli]
MEFEKFESSNVQSDLIRLLVSKTLQKYGVKKKSVSANEKQRLRQLVSKLQEDTESFLENTSKAHTESDFVSGDEEGIEKPIKKNSSSPIQFRRRYHNK